MKRKHQERATIIADNLSTPLRPRSPKAPKPVMVQAKASATVRTNDAPSDMGKHSARFHDPIGNAMKARRETKPGKIDMSYRWSDQPEQLAMTYRTDRRYPPTKWGTVTVELNALQQARLRDAVLQYTIQSERLRDRGFEPEPRPRSLEPCVTFGPIERIGFLAKVSCHATDIRGAAFIQAGPRHYTVSEMPREAFTIALRPCPMPRVLALPVNTYTGDTEASWNHPKPAKGLVVTIVTKSDDTLTIDAPDWSTKTRKRLFNRIPIQSRSAKKRGFRLVPRHEGIKVYGHLPASKLKRRNPLPVIPDTPRKGI